MRGGARPPRGGGVLDGRAGHLDDDGVPLVLDGKVRALFGPADGGTVRRVDDHCGESGGQLSDDAENLAAGRALDQDAAGVGEQFGVATVPGTNPDVEAPAVLDEGRAAVDRIGLQDRPNHVEIEMCRLTADESVDPQVVTH
ncbi:hypothetical protein ABZ721_37120 [Streptomyces sp. NPDC006733]|uniref:hypothetical protein n=1 Tax=Streptomyces sp. NPDC006733 TaxID=3155460 RepID=UPI00340703DF